MLFNLYYGRMYKILDHALRLRRPNHLTHMDQARHVLMGNLAKHAQAARGRLAMTLTSVSDLTGLSVMNLIAVEIGENESDLSLDELTGLALFLGLTARGELRVFKPSGSDSSKSPS